MKWVICRLIKVLVVGLFLFLGVACTLSAFGVTESWGPTWLPWTEGNGKFLWEMIQRPWNALAAVVWLGIGTLYFEK